MSVYPGFIGSAGRIRSVNVNAERTVNWYLEQAPGNPKTKNWLCPTPGLEPFTVLPTGPVRALFAMDGRAFAVSGTAFVEIFASGNALLRGNVNQNAFPATISSNGANGHQLFITSAGINWLYDLITNSFTLVDTTNPPTPTRMSYFSDGYFIALRGNTNQFNISALYDGSTWDPLDVFLVSTVADQVVALVENHRDLWLLGSQTSSVWSNTGDEVVYAPIPGVKIDQGCGAAFSAVRIDNAVMWLGQSEAGDRVMWRADGYTPRRVSTHAVEFALAQAPRVDDAIAWVYQEEGHTFYVLYVPQLAEVRSWGTTWVYDVATDQWHERALWDVVAMDWQPHPGRCHAFGFGRHLVGDRSSGAIYSMSLNLASDTLVVSVTAGGPTAPIPGLAVPTLTNIAPDEGVQGTSPTVTLTGTGFVVGATTVSVSGTGVSVSDVAVSGPLSLTAEFTITGGATLSARSVTVTTVAGTSGAVSFTVTDAAVEPPPEGLLTPDDITFVGYYRFPVANWNLAYTTALALREVGGETRLFSLAYDGAPVERKLVEYTLPAAAPAMTLAGAPHLTDLVDHGSIFDDCFANAGIPVSTDLNAVNFGGLCWDADLGGVWFTTGDPYGVSPDHYPTLSFAKFTGEALASVHGPWRTTIHPNRTCGPLVPIPSSFGDAYLDGARIGVTMGSGSGASTRAAGCSLAAITDFDPTALAAAAPPNPAPVSVANGQVEETTWLFQHDVAHPQQRDDNYRLCFWWKVGDAGSQNYNCTLNQHIESPGTNWGGNVATLINENDSITGVAWIRTATKRGLVFFGQLTTTPAGFTAPGSDPDGLVHAWYGDPAHGTNTGSGFTDGECCHGQDDPYWGATGGGSHYNVPHMWIYDDEDLIPAIAGDIDLWEVEPQSVTQLVDGSGDIVFPDVPLNQMPSGFFGACVYDATNARIYAIVKNVDTGSQPVVAVFEVSA